MDDVMQAVNYVIVVDSIASSRWLSKLPGVRLMDPTMAFIPSARSILACS
jgi:hypothetical protein